MTSNRHQRREAKAARRRKRLATGNRPRRLNMPELKGVGYGRMVEMVTKNAPKGFGQAKRDRGESAESLLERVWKAAA